MGKESLEKKLEKKKLEPRKISPEEQKSIDNWEKGREERERIARETEEKRSLELKEQHEDAEFRKKCKKMLEPIFKKIQALVFKENKSAIFNNDKVGQFDSTSKGLYKISLCWNYYSNWEDHHDASSGYSYGWGSKIELSVVLNTEWDKESKFIISNLSEDKLVETKITRRNWIKKVLLGEEPIVTERVWIKKVTLNDPNWKTQVEDYILEELKQKKAI